MLETDAVDGIHFRHRLFKSAVTYSYKMRHALTAPAVIAETK